MYLLEGCYSGLKPIMTLAGYVIFVIQIGIPIVLVILGSIDLGKAVIESKEDEVKKAKKTFIRRLIYAVAVFAVVWIVKLVIGFIPTILGDEYSGGTNNWNACWNCVVSKGKATNGCTYVDTLE